MILLTRLRGGQFLLNCDLIETVTETPDTMILLTNGDTYIVQEPMEEVAKLAMAYKKKIFENFRS